MPPSRPTDDSWRSSRIGMGNSKCFSRRSRPARLPRSRKGTATDLASEVRGAQPRFHSGRLRAGAFGHRGDGTRLVPLIGGAPRPFLGKGDNACVVVSRWQPHGLHDQHRRRSDHGRGPPWCESDSDLPKRKWAPQSCASLVYRWTVDLLHPRHPERQPHEHLASTADAAAAPEALTDREVVTSLAPLDSRTVLYTARDRVGAGPWLWALDTETRTSRPGDPGPRAVHLDRGVRRWATARRVRGQTARRTL